ncbi:MAG: hypothetical protein AABY07_04240 [Nanoarchaeota archaeon]
MVRLYGPKGEPIEENIEQRGQTAEERPRGPGFFRRLGRTLAPEYYERTRGARAVRRLGLRKSAGVAARRAGGRITGLARAGGLEEPVFLFLSLIFDVLTILSFFYVGLFLGFVIMFIGLIIFIPRYKLSEFLVSILRIFLTFFTSLAGYVPLFTILYFSRRLSSGKKYTAAASGGAGGGMFSGGYGKGYTPYEKGYGEEIGVRRAREGRWKVQWDLWIRPILKFVFVILIIGVLVYIGYRVSTGGFGGIKEDFAVLGKVGTGELKLSKFFGGIYDSVARRIREPFAKIGAWEPEYQEGVIVKGVTIENMHTTKLEFIEGEEIEILAHAKIDALEKDATVAFGCGIEEGKDNIKTGSVTVVGNEEGNNKVNVPMNVNKRVPIVCKIPAYDKLDRDYALKSAFLSWVYEDFETRTILRTFTLSNAEKTRRQAANEDIMRPHKGRYIDSDGFSVPICVSGCGLTDLSLRLNAENPVTESNEYYLDVILTGVIYGARKGDMKNLDSIKIKLPEGMSAGEGGCGGFERGDPLAFDSYDAGFQRFNQNLTTQNKDAYSFICRVKVEQSGVSDELNAKTIIGNAIYDYGDREPMHITLRKKELSTGLT